MAVLGLILLYFLIVIAVHYNVKNRIVTVMPAVAGFVIISVALGVDSPRDIIRIMENRKVKQYGTEKGLTLVVQGPEDQWRISGSNRRPLACHASALAN